MISKCGIFEKCVGGWFQMNIMKVGKGKLSQHLNSNRKFQKWKIG